MGTARFFHFGFSNSDFGLKTQSKESKIQSEYTFAMEFAARQFARRVLAFHLALLCVVLLAVGLDQLKQRWRDA